MASSFTKDSAFILARCACSLVIGLETISVLRRHGSLSAVSLSLSSFHSSFNIKICIRTISDGAQTTINRRSIGRNCNQCSESDIVSELNVEMYLKFTHSSNLLRVLNTELIQFQITTHDCYVCHWFVSPFPAPFLVWCTYGLIRSSCTHTPGQSMNRDQKKSDTIWTHNLPIAPGVC